MTSTASTTSVTSMTSTAFFYQKQITELDVSINPDTKMTYSGLLMFDGSLKIHYFIDFWHLFFWRLWRTGKLLLTKSKAHMSNSHYSGFPNYLQTKSNLYISICQSQIHQVKSRWETLQLSKVIRMLVYKRSHSILGWIWPSKLHPYNLRHNYIIQGKV